jgi:hypothetical protein
MYYVSLNVCAVYDHLPATPLCILDHMYYMDSRYHYMYYSITHTLRQSDVIHYISPGHGRLK